MDILEKIESRKAVVAVVGLGYVGLPLAVAFAEAGFKVFGIDSDDTKVDMINRGESYLQDVTSQQLSEVASDGVQDGQGRLHATLDYSSLDETDAAIVCVPTPLGKTKDPDLSYIISASDELSHRVHRGMLVVLESTTYPGTTEEVILPRLQGPPSREMAAGTDFFLAYSPERIDPGNSEWTVQRIPKVVGGHTPKCLEVATKLYETIVETVVPVSSPRTAEMVKQLENTFRASNIALVNEMAIICDRLDVDVWEVIEAAKTKPFGFMPFYPGPGLGGHCLPVDPQFLAWKLRTLNYNSRFVQMAEEINLGMPPYVATKISDALNEDGKPLKGSKILVLGVAYKADTSDTRESPAIDLIELLVEKGAVVNYHDPHIPRLETDGFNMDSIELDDSALRSSDCVVITTAHSSYDWQWIVDRSDLVFDARNATVGVNESSRRVVKL